MQKSAEDQLADLPNYLREIKCGHIAFLFEAMSQADREEVEFWLSEYDITMFIPSDQTLNDILKSKNLTMQKILKLDLTELLFNFMAQTNDLMRGKKTITLLG